MTNDRVLFITESWPITPDGFGGGSAVLYSRLQLLAYSGVEIHLVTLGTPNTIGDFRKFLANQPQEWKEVHGWLKAYYHIDLEVLQLSSRKIPFQTTFKLIRDPSGVFFPQLNQRNIDKLREIFHIVCPTFVWSEHYLATWFSIKSFTNVPIIYGHHDWEYKLIPLRDRSKSTSMLPLTKRLKLLIKGYLRRSKRKQLDKSIVKRVDSFASVSATEAIEATKIGTQNSWYLPPTYPAVKGTNVSNIVLSKPRIIHLGQMRTTASRLGLEDFLRLCWPNIVQSSTEDKPELWIIGRMDGASPYLVETLDRIGANQLGYVQQLANVLRPYDIHVVPWSFNTGVRTRIPLALNYSQVLVAFRRTSSCLSELKDRENCFLVDSFTQMAQIVTILTQDDDLRKRIGEAGRHTFLSYYTREGIQPYFNNYLRQFLNKVKT